MRRKFSILRLLLCAALALALPIGMQAGLEAAGKSCAGCASAHGDESSSKPACPKANLCCVVAGPCAFSCATEVPNQVATYVLSLRIAEQTSLDGRAMAVASHAAKPDPYPPRSRT